MTTEDQLVRVLAEALPGWGSHRLVTATKQAAALRAHFASEEVRERIDWVVQGAWQRGHVADRLLAALDLAKQPLRAAPTEGITSDGRPYDTSHERLL